MRFRYLALAGVLAGTLDASVAARNALLDGRFPSRMFKFIASGALGKSAFDGGVATTIAGILFHYLIAFSWATAYFVAQPRIKRVIPNPIVSGLLYGVVIWLGMNLIVVPLSNVPGYSLDAPSIAIGMGILMVCVGLPVALIADRASRAEKAPPDR